MENREPVRSLVDRFQQLLEDHEVLRRAAIRLVALRAKGDTDVEEMDLRIVDLAVAAGCSTAEDALRELAGWGHPVKSSHGGESMRACEIGRSR